MAQKEKQKKNETEGFGATPKVPVPPLGSVADPRGNGARPNVFGSIPARVRSQVFFPFTIRR